MLQVDKDSGEIVKSTADSLIIIREKEAQQRSLKLFLTNDGSYDHNWTWSKLQYYDVQGMLSDLTTDMEQVYSSGKICFYQ